jgi:hypothetical protein
MSSRKRKPSPTEVADIGASPPLRKRPKTNNDSEVNVETIEKDKETPEGPFVDLSLEFFRIICHYYKPHDMDLCSISRVCKKWQILIQATYSDSATYQRVYRSCSPALGRHLNIYFNLITVIRQRWGLDDRKESQEIVNVQNMQNLLSEENKKKNKKNNISQIVLVRKNKNELKIAKIVNGWKWSVATACAAGDTQSALNIFHKLHLYCQYKDGKSKSKKRKNSQPSLDAIPFQIFSSCFKASTTETFDSIVKFISSQYPDLDYPSSLEQHNPMPWNGNPCAKLVIRYLRLCSYFNMPVPKNVVKPKLDEYVCQDYLADLEFKNLTDLYSTGYYSLDNRVIAHLLAYPELNAWPCVQTLIRTTMQRDSRHGTFPCPRSQSQLDYILPFAIDGYWDNIWIKWGRLPHDQSSANMFVILNTLPQVHQSRSYHNIGCTPIHSAALNPFISHIRFIEFWNRHPILAAGSVDQNKFSEVLINEVLKQIIETAARMENHTPSFEQKLFENLEWIVGQQSKVRDSFKQVQECSISISLPLSPWGYKVVNFCIDQGISINSEVIRQRSFSKLDHDFKSRLWNQWESEPLHYQLPQAACHVMYTNDHSRLRQWMLQFPHILAPNNVICSDVACALVKKINVGNLKALSGFDLPDASVMFTYPYADTEQHYFMQAIFESRDYVLLKLVYDRFPLTSLQWIRTWSCFFAPKYSKNCPPFTHPKDSKNCSFAQPFVIAVTRFLLKRIPRPMENSTMVSTHDLLEQLASSLVELYYSRKNKEGAWITETTTLIEDCYR